ncbi:MAG: indolepyruvate ferredoxin oxidoreductase subunit alpha [Candidatus Merdivicinus sp.]|jgi:indolepyruvate ferredoxin oxidoreductase alpha subunit
MPTELLMGNQAVALGAIRAGVGVVAGYPGTPSTETLETVASRNPGDIYVEWSTNEKAALEVAAGAALSGVRSLVTMKQVGLNVASDPLMSLAYIGVKAGMVVLAADDPGPISSQTEQDTRQFAEFANLPVFDPSSPEEAYRMIQDAFDYSEKYQTPVLFRPTTRICHGCAAIELDGKRREIPEGDFVKDPKWVIFPRLSFQNHLKLNARQPVLAEDFSGYAANRVCGSGKKGIAAGGVSWEYLQEALGELNADCRLLKVATPNPFPEGLAMEFLDGLDEVLVVEELSPVIERALVQIAGRKRLAVEILGRQTGHIAGAGENTVESVKKAAAAILGIPLEEKPAAAPPELPVRPPVLCAGCPHRASFYAVKQAMKGQKAVFCGDIGCYTLGNAMPLDMVDTCLCMGAGITMAQGIRRAAPGAKTFAFVGDSTFFASGITGVVNAVYNETDMTLIVLDNSTTAMTGHQPHPGTGKTMMGDVTGKISIARVLEAVGVKHIARVNPLHLEEAVAAVREAAAVKGVSAVLFESPCIAVVKPDKAMRVDAEKCVGCRRCIRELGCPALELDGKKVRIEGPMCTGCTLCAQVCPTSAIGREKE